jgi:hypothetical protein
VIPEFKKNRILSRNSDVLFTHVGGEIALMSIPNGRYYALNPVASSIWLKLEQPRMADELATILSAEYRSEPGQIEKDLRDTLEQWLEWSLITASERILD